MEHTDEEKNAPANGHQTPAGNKKGGTGCLILVIILLLGGWLFHSCSAPKAPEPTKQTAQTLAELPSYDIPHTEKLSFDRLALQVVVKDPATVEQLKSISAKIVEDTKKAVAFRAITIFFNDYPEYIGTGAALGIVTYGPNGNIAADQSVKPGDYAKMSFSYDLKEKDWSKRLTPEEVQIWASWQNYYQERRKANDGRREEVLRDEFAANHNISNEKMSGISFKQFSWSL